MSSLENKLERLASASIDLVPASGLSRHFLFTRDRFVALVERRDEGFGAIGAAGLATEEGFAALTWQDGQARFVAHGWSQEATLEEVESLRAFQRDLRAALAD